MVSKIKSDKNVDSVGQGASSIQKIDVNDHQYQIALAAYYKAERRGFTPGQELSDWLEAEHDMMGNP